jgi:hypothetical protein
VEILVGTEDLSDNPAGVVFHALQCFHNCNSRPLECRPASSDKPDFLV